MITKKIILSLIFVSITSTAIIIPVVYNPDLDYKFALELIQKASERIIIGNMSISFDAFLWRDFMPGVEEGGTGIYAAIVITATNVSLFPSYINCNEMWVVNFGQSDWIPEETPQVEMWNTKLEHIGIEDNTLQKRADNGPKWDIGIILHVIIELSKLGGQKYYLWIQTELEATY